MAALLFVFVSKKKIIYLLLMSIWIDFSMIALLIVYVTDFC
jgi:hypothetical protein